MKRALLCALLAVVVILGGCVKHADRVDSLFYCTQERVCAPLKDLAEYGFSDRAEDTGIIIPGLGKNFIPQGIAYWEDKGQLLISGYFLPLSGMAAAALLAVDAETGGMVGEYSLIDDTGRELGGHFSGVAIAERDVYVTGRHSLYRVPFGEFDRVGRKGALAVAQELPVELSSDSCNYSSGMLWVCEYYQPDIYPLVEEHVTVNRDGTQQHAWLAGYEVTETGALEPRCVFSVPDKIQGITILADGQVFLSQSYGRKNPSQLLLFNDPRKEVPDSYVVLEGKKVPMWHLGSQNLAKDLSAPPMAEGCCAVGSGVYLLFESAAYYYHSLNPDNRSIHPTDTVWYLDMKQAEHRSN